MNELKPCPFCEGEAHLITHKFTGAADSYGIECKSCRTQSYQFYDTPEDAIAAWNRRTRKPDEWCMDCK